MQLIKKDLKMFLVIQNRVTIVFTMQKIVTLVRHWENYHNWSLSLKKEGAKVTKYLRD